MRNGILYRILNFVFFASAFRIAYAQQVIVGGKVGNATEVLPAATISLNNKTTLSNSKGEFAFSVKPARYQLQETDFYLEQERFQTRAQLQKLLASRR